MVLVLTETKHYKTLGSKDFGKGLPAKVETFVSCRALYHCLVSRS